MYKFIRLAERRFTITSERFVVSAVLDLKCNKVSIQIENLKSGENSDVQWFGVHDALHAVSIACSIADQYELMEG